MRPLKILPAALALVGVLALAAGTAWAGPDEGQESIEAQIKAQMDKIIQLMEENEAAILEASTGGKETPKKVDVEVPPAPEAEGPSSTGSEGSSGSSGSERAGESAAKKLEELIRTSRGTGNRIPGELEELVKMVPQ